MGVLQDTLLNILFYVFLVTLGIVLGSRKLPWERVSRWLDRLQFFCLMALILALGMKLGADDQVIASLGRIGLAALLIALSSMAGSLLAVSILRRFILKLDQFGCPAGTGQSPDDSRRPRAKANNTLTKWIVAAVAVGMAVGCFVLPEGENAWCGTVIDYGLYLLLFLVGIDLGRHGNVLMEIKEAGLKALLVPLSVMIGTLLFAFAASFLLPLSARDTVASAAGFGWYSLAPTLLAPHSLSVSAIAFLANVMRELFSIVAIPFVARSVGYLECVSLPGAAAMDTVLPVIVGSTHERITIYAFISGMLLSLSVPVMITVIIAL